MGRVGLELEWLVVDAAAPQSRPSVDRVRQLLRPDKKLPAGGTLSFEAGGQLELSTIPYHSIVDCVISAATDIADLRSRAASTDILLRGRGLDSRVPRRMTESSRYARLEEHYDRYGPYGRVMLYNTASIQINLDAGDESDGNSGYRHRWLLANRLGLVLSAMFANSPIKTPIEARSGRQFMRFHTDPTRTDPLRLSSDPRSAWADYALDARVAFVASADTGEWDSPPPGLTMRMWLRLRRPRPATLEDLLSHLSSLVPPVRARGYYELRMIDAQEGDNWVVPAVVASTLIDDPEACEKISELLATVQFPGERQRWIWAGRCGLRSDDLAAVAAASMRIALQSMKRLTFPDWVHQQVDRFAHKYTYRRRTPADDVRWGE